MMALTTEYQEESLRTSAPIMGIVKKMPPVLAFSLIVVLTRIGLMFPDIAGRNVKLSVQEVLIRSAVYTVFVMIWVSALVSRATEIEAANSRA
jgi:hypothetical protein